ncbi:MAG: sensor histidine kinase [Huintestinicola sp.]|uniref:sensor histidine kinase n=1 Tax=Huintestinicola sp. TaxID=2981661 RepID=UPI003F0B8C63
MKLVGSKNSSIRNQMLIMFLIVILPLFAASIMLLVNMRSEVTERIISTANVKADSIRTRIADTVDSVEAAMDMFVTDENVIAFLENDYETNAEYYKYYSRGPHQRYLESFPQIDSVKVYTGRSDFVCNADYIYADEQIEAQTWYNKARLDSDVFFWDTVIDRKDGIWHLGCIKAIKKDNKVIGIAAALISEDWINRSVSSEESKSILCVGEGSVFFSNYEGAKPGGRIEYDESISMNGRNVLKEGLLGFKGYTITENFQYGENFQIIFLIPAGVADLEINKLIIIYGGYFCLFFILSLLIIVLFTSVFSRRITLLSEKMHAVAGGDFNVEFTDKGHDEIAELYTDLEQMIHSMQTMMNDVYQAKLQNEEFKFVQMEAEFKALASQINPHFLYNTLETIRMKAFCNNDKETADLVKKLGKFMRRCLEFKDGEVTLRSELEFTNGYLELQSARFGDRVSYSIYSEVSKDYMILPLVIQPVVENAFVHGIESCKDNGRIDIKVYYSGDNVIIDVKDNGSGMSKEKLRELEAKLRRNDTSSGKSIGLTNVNKRIKMYHGERYGLTIKTKEGGGTTIRITLPRNPVSRSSAAGGSITTDTERR